MSMIDGAAPAGEVLIRLRSVRKVFRAGTAAVHALADIDLEVREGEYIAISGPSGCGKSSLLALMGLLDTPTTGVCHLRGQPVASLTPDQRARVRGREIGFVFQAFNLIGDLTAYENVEVPLIYRRMPEPKRRERVLSALERVGMGDRVSHYPAELSGGQQQRVAIARAIAGRPGLLLADEPTGNLDSANGAAVMELLGELHAEGSAVVLVTHDPDHALHAQRVLHLLDGRIVREERVASSGRGRPPDGRVES